MTRAPIQSHAGYSLVELLVYVAMFAVVAVVVINSLLISTRSFAETRTNRELMHAGFDIVERISREIRQAESVDIPGSALGSHPGTLVLLGSDEDGDDREVGFAVENGAVVLYENGVSQGALSDAHVEVASLVFRNISTAGADAVRVELSLTRTRGSSSKTADFFDTIILRGSYQ